MSFWKWSTTASTNATADSTINWAEGMAPSAVNDSARAMMTAAAKFRLDQAGVTTGGTSTAYTVTSNQVFDTLAHLDGNVLCIIPHATNGASPTLNVDGLGAKAINRSTGVAVETSSLLITSPYLVRYINASTEFIVMDQRAIAASSLSDGTTGSGNIVLASSFVGSGTIVKAGGSTGTSSGNIVYQTSPTLTTPNIGLATGTSLAATGLLTSSSPSAGIGYATGAGAAVTQSTSKSTGVTINAVTGKITMHNATLNGPSSVVFTVTNSAVAATDVIVLNFQNAVSANTYIYMVDVVAAGSFNIHIRNISGVNVSDAIVLNFLVIKGVIS